MKAIVRRIGDWINYSRSRRLGVALTAVIALIVEGVGVYNLATSLCERSGGVYRTMMGVKECIAVTDGSFYFAPELSGVEEKILDQNRIVEKRGSYVTVAYMGPLSDGEPLAEERTKAILEGAYIGQLDADQEGTPIRLVLANDGSDTSQWSQVVGKLKSMANGKDRLRAVVGMQRSTTGTQLAARELSNNGIPVVGDLISADGLDRTSGISDLSRVSPPNRTEVRALADYASRHGLKSAVLVSSNDASDLYTETLAKDFRVDFKPRMPELRYDAPAPGELNRQFAVISENICGENPPDMVLYAGRVELLPNFVEQFARVNCKPQNPVTILTGDDGTSLPLSTEIRRVANDPLNVGSVSVVYPSVSDPDALLAPSNPAHQAFQKFKDEFTRDAKFDYNDLRYESPVLTYDAVQSVAQAIRLTDASVPSLSAVRGPFNLMTSPRRFAQGANGDFGFDQFGNPVCQSLSLLQLTIRPNGGNISKSLIQQSNPTQPPSGKCPSE